MKQRGYNDKYPETIEAWRLNEKIPEWLSDRAKITFIDGSGNVTLDKTDDPDGGYAIKDASGTRELVRTKSKDDYVCFGNNKVFSLSRKQLEILYESN